jgi:hypothetical protein
MDQPYQDQREPNDILPLTMEILTADSRQDRDSNESDCSLRSLVSGDNDSLLLVDSFYELDEEDRDASPTLHHHQCSSSPARHRRLHSYPTISTEMAIIASSSPEIKALSSSQTISPSFHRGLFFDFYQEENETEVKKLKARTTFVCPFSATNNDHIHDKNSEKRRNRTMRQDKCYSSEVSSPTLQHAKTRLDEADELKLFVERRSLVRDVASPPTVIGEYKENVSPPFNFEGKTPEATDTNRSYDGCALTARSALCMETKPHHPLSSMVGSNKRRTSFHRRVSFNSLPSPSEIASLRALPPTPVHSSISIRGEAAPTGKSPLAMDFPFF